MRRLFWTGAVAAAAWACDTDGAGVGGSKDTGTDGVQIDAEGLVGGGNADVSPTAGTIPVADEGPPGGSTGGAQPTDAAVVDARDPVDVFDPDVLLPDAESKDALAPVDVPSTVGDLAVEVDGPPVGTPCVVAEDCGDAQECAAGACEDVSPVCFEGELRMVGGVERVSGRVEVCHAGQWGTVCDVGVGVEEAAVVCAALGLPTAGAAVLPDVPFGPGVGRIWVSGFDCIGDELNPRNCPGFVFGPGGCTHEDDLSIECIEPDEVCNGLDDDGDGQIDDGAPGGGEPCNTALLGECSTGVTACRDGRIQCVALSLPTPETCNGLDDNCDGQVDDGTEGAGVPCATGGAGECAAGVTVCADASLVCQPVGLAAEETCNGRDDDCDGSADEAAPGAGVPCDSGRAGLCGPGLTVCDAGAPACVAEVAPDAEACNGLDDDCDGTTDEEVPDGADCDTGLLGVCSSGASICFDGRTICVGLAQRGDEVCNGLDDDCDGAADDGIPEVGGVCDTGAAGRCAPGTVACTNGALGCVANASPIDEVCNGQDDDCDGQVDDGASNGGPCDSGQPGVCAAGTSSCVDGGFVCIAAVRPSNEVCNGLDDDCDGAVDEGGPGAGVGCVTGQAGACALGQTVCENGGIVCRGAGAVNETCNGQDDDCDGVPDDGNPQGGGACATGRRGVCGPGVLQCNAARLDCVGLAQATDESCNGLDDDCDGATDDGDPGGGRACNSGLLGICAAGTTTCANGALQCRGAQAQAERCDGIDNDCDGLVDDDNPGGGLPCNTGVPGACGAGVTVCQGGQIACRQVVNPVGETCNGLDDDCDGRIDNGDPGAGVACNTGNAGICAAGITACRAGRPVCVQQQQPRAEACNGVDDDCNGAVDNGNPGGGVACGTGQAGICGPGTTACQNGGIACNQNQGPGAEVCNGIDDNCNGAVDDGAGCNRRPLFADGPGYPCPTGAVDFDPGGPADPTSREQALRACEACYGAGACFEENADCAGLGWGPRPAGEYACGEAYFGWQDGCSGSDGRAWYICSSYTTFGYWGR